MGGQHRLKKGDRQDLAYEFNSHQRLAIRPYGNPIAPFWWWWHGFGLLVKLCPQISLLRFALLGFGWICFVFFFSTRNQSTHTLADQRVNKVGKGARTGGRDISSAHVEKVSEATLKLERLGFKKCSCLVCYENECDMANKGGDGSCPKSQLQHLLESMQFWGEDEWWWRMCGFGFSLVWLFVCLFYVFGSLESTILNFSAEDSQFQFHLRWRLPNIQSELRMWTRYWKRAKSTSGGVRSRQWKEIK